jgi:hypothetical protein
MPLDSFWDDILGDARNTLGGLFNDITDRWVGNYGQPSLPDRSLSAYGGLFVPDRSILAGNPFVQSMGWADLTGQRKPAASSTPMQVNVFQQARDRKAQAAAAAQAQAQAPAPAQGVTANTALPMPSDPALRALAEDAAKANGLDVQTFLNLVGRESSWNPAAASGAGAEGLTQLMPETAAGLGVTNRRDPQQSLMGGAKYLKSLLDKYGGDYSQALSAYLNGPGNHDAGRIAPSTQGYIHDILTAAPQTSPAANPGPAAAEAAPNSAKPLKGITPYQWGSESLATGVADAICGVIAAKVFAAVNGREMTLAEALDMARKTGTWDSENGMHGIESTAKLVRSLGGNATVGEAHPRTMVEELQAGRPVILDTPHHYFVAEDYDPQTGKFDLGNSARTLARVGPNGNTWFTLAEISGLGMGDVRGAIYAR